MPVTAERYNAVMDANMGRTWNLKLDPVSVGMLHGAIRLMLLHPRVKSEYSESFKRLATHYRNWCLVRFREMGFTEAEIQALDSELSPEEGG